MLFINFNFKILFIYLLLLEKWLVKEFESVVCNIKKKLKENVRA